MKQLCSFRSGVFFAIIAISLGGCARVAMYAFYVPIVALNILLLPLYPFLELPEQEFKNGITSIVSLPETGHYVATHRVDNKQSIYLFDIEQQTSRLNSDNNRFLHSLQLHVNGNHLLYVNMKKPSSNRSKIQEMNIQTGEVTTLVESTHLLASPVYQFEKNAIVYIEKRGKYSHLHEFDRDSQSTTQLTTGKVAHFSPIPLRGGKRLVFQRANWYGHYSPIASSTWHDVDWYEMNLEDGTTKTITGNQDYGAASIRRNTESGYVQLGKRTFLSLDGVRTARHTYYRQLREKQPDMGNVWTTHILPDAEHDQVFYAVVRRHESDFSTEFYELKTRDDLLESITTVPFKATWPKYDPRNNEFYFGGPDANSIYSVGLDGKLRTLQIAIESNNHEK